MVWRWSKSFDQLIQRNTSGDRHIEGCFCASHGNMNHLVCQKQHLRIDARDLVTQDHNNMLVLSIQVNIIKQ